MESRTSLFSEIWNDIVRRDEGWKSSSLFDCKPIGIQRISSSQDLRASMGTSMLCILCDMSLEKSISN